MKQIEIAEDFSEFEHMELLIKNLLEFQSIPDLKREVKLAISIILVGSSKTDKFVCVFRMLCSFEDLGGCFWVVQEELLRHAFLGEMNTIMDGDYQAISYERRLRDALEVTVPAVVPSYVKHNIVREKIPALRASLEKLINKMISSGRPKVN